MADSSIYIRKIAITAELGPALEHCAGPSDRWRAGIVSALAYVSVVATQLALGACGTPGGSHVSTVGSAANAVVVGTVLDSAGTHPVHPSRVELAGGPPSVLGDSLGRFTLTAVPRGRQTLRVRGIGFIEQRIPIVVDRDTVRLPDIRLWPNHTLDSVRVTVP